MPSNDFWNQTPGAIQSCSLLGARTVTSELISLNAVTRTVQVAIPALLTCAGLGSTSLGSTNYVLWRPLNAVQIQRVQLIPEADGAVPGGASGGQLVVYVSNGCSTMGQYTTTSTAPFTLGQRIDLGTLSNVSVAACVDVRCSITVSSCGAFPAANFQIDYLSTA